MKKKARKNPHENPKFSKATEKALAFLRTPCMPPEGPLEFHEAPPLPYPTEFFEDDDEEDHEAAEAGADEIPEIFKTVPEWSTANSRAFFNRVLRPEIVSVIRGALFQIETMGYRGDGGHEKPWSEYLEVVEKEKEAFERAGDDEVARFRLRQMFDRAYAHVAADLIERWIGERERFGRVCETAAANLDAEFFRHVATCIEVVGRKEPPANTFQYAVLRAHGHCHDSAPSWIEIREKLIEWESDPPYNVSVPSGFGKKDIEVQRKQIEDALRNLGLKFSQKRKTRSKD
jgi:hypothetical protein